MEAADREQASGRALGRGPPDARDRLPLLAAIAVAPPAPPPGALPAAFGPAPSPGPRALARSVLPRPLRSRRRPLRVTRIPRMRAFALAPGLALALALALASGTALADRVAIVPTRGPTDAPVTNAIDVDLARGLVALGHTVVPEAELRAALGAVADGVADTAEEYRAVGARAKADWVVAATVEPAVVTERVEIAAFLVPMGRTESVAREVEKARAEAQLREMIGVLLRPEGIGAGELPWERRPSSQVAGPAPSAPPPVAPSPQAVAFTPPAPPVASPPVPERAWIDYLRTTEIVWPPYAAGRRGFLAVMVGGSGAVLRPEAAAGSAAAFVGQVRGGYAVGDAGLELIGSLGGNLVGPRALFVEAGARFLFTPSLHRGADGLLRGLSLHVGPELTAGAFVRLPPPDVTDASGAVYSGSASAHFTGAVALDLVVAVTPALRFEGGLPQLRWVPTGDGSILVLGATLGAGYRF